MNVPLLLIVFNRPLTTIKVLEAIRKARPNRLYIAADGPRDMNDKIKCDQVRQIATAIDWKCEVRRLYRETNLGCRYGPSTAISWFFEHEQEGIILEDDCVPSQSFFRFCAELLERYRHDERILSINGDNFQKDMRDYPYSYYFSNYFHCWGWASWARAWKINDAAMSAYPEWTKDNRFESISKVPGFGAYWKREMDMVYAGKLEAWCSIFMLSCWTKHGFSIVPRVNMVSNIGYGPDGIHCHYRNDPMANLPRADIEFPLSHPDAIEVNSRADDFVSEHIFKVGRHVPAL